MASVNQIIEQAERLAAEAVPSMWEADDGLLFGPDGDGFGRIDDYYLHGIDIVPAHKTAAYIAHVNSVNMQRIIAAFKEMRSFIVKVQDFLPMQIPAQEAKEILAKLEAEE